MPHTPLAKLLRHAASTAAQSERRDATVDDTAMSRREFVRTISAATAGLALPSSLFGARQVTTSARVAVVGAGLAGLTCAYRLKRSGINATVYEANTRLGGRCWTRRDDFEHGHNAEHGGELIDQGHTSIRQLAQELGLPLDNLLAAEPNGSTIFPYFDGVAYSYRDVVRDLKRIWRPLHRDLIEAGYPTLYNSYTARGAQLDQMSVSDWINQTVPGGLGLASWRVTPGGLYDRVRRGMRCPKRAQSHLSARIQQPRPVHFVRSFQREVSCSRRKRSDCHAACGLVRVANYHGPIPRGAAPKSGWHLHAYVSGQ